MRRSGSASHQFAKIYTDAGAQQDPHPPKQPPSPKIHSLPPCSRHSRNLGGGWGGASMARRCFAGLGLGRVGLEYGCAGACSALWAAGRRGRGLGGALRQLQTAA